MVPLLLSVSLLCPLLIFLDDHKRSNIHWAIVYVVGFFLVWKFVLSWLIIKYGLFFAGSVPILLLLPGIITRKRKA